MVGQKPPLKPREVWSIRTRLQVADAERDLALFNLAIDSKLRGCDLVTITVGDVALSGTVRDRAVIVQKKTGRPVQFEITEQTRAAVGAWIARSQLAETDFLFPSPRPGHAPHVDEAVWKDRRQVYKKTGNIRAVQLLLGHTKLESTVRYLGIEVDDALAISEQVEL
ncbi:integrase [Allomesorhizobium camelthorni]|uniref:integrase n=1 Tax=Allomesorhizobium camelthorni TaxID=475069 RepID=UPI0031B59F44